MSVTSTIAHIHNIFTFPLIACRMGIICTTAINSRSWVWQTPTYGCDCGLRFSMRCIHRTCVPSVAAVRVCISIVRQNEQPTLCTHSTKLSNNNRTWVSKRPCWFCLLLTQSRALKCSRVFRILNEWAQSKFRESTHTQVGCARWTPSVFQRKSMCSQYTHSILWSRQKKKFIHSRL